MARPSGSDRTRPELRRQCRPKPGLQACGELPGVVAEPPVCRGSVHHSKVMPVTGYVNPLTAAPPSQSSFPGMPALTEHRHGPVHVG